jgi:hypothetical protein
MSVTRRTFLTTGMAALAATSSGAQGRAYTLEAGDAGKTLEAPDGRVVFGYLTQKPAGIPLAGNSACCIHPFNTPGGHTATDIAPPDHRDHRGIFFAWHDVSFARDGETLRGDFWGWGRFAPVDGRVIVNRELRLGRADAISAQVLVRNDWTIGDRVVMHEDATIGVSERDSVRRLDLTYRFTSDYEVTVNRMAFTGLCFRCRKDGKYFYSDTNGEVTRADSQAAAPDSDWPAQPWYSHTVVHEDGTTVASALVDHPSNPPSLWHGVRAVSFLNPCISAQKAVQIPAGQALTLRYLALTRDGLFQSGDLNAIAAEWRTRTA